MTDHPRQPAVYLPHGGGPWPWMEAAAFGVPRAYDALKAYLQALPGLLPAPPRAALVVTAHWEAPVPTVSSAAAPGMLYDYAGFPPHTYRVSWPAPGDPALAARVRALLEAAGLPSAEDRSRGFDHGTFVPMAVAWPDARLPTVQLSLVRCLDPALHLAVGRALAALRDEGVLIVGSGLSYHNLRAFFAGDGAADGERFDAWLQQVVRAAPDERDQALCRWTSAPSARAAHPREEHLLPLMVAAGAAGEDRGQVTFSAPVLGVPASAVHFG